MNNREKFKEAIINKYGYHNFTIDDAKAICESIGLTDSQYKTIYTHVMRHVKVDKGIYAFPKSHTFGTGQKSVKISPEVVKAAKKKTLKSDMDVISSTDEIVEKWEKKAKQLRLLLKNQKLYRNLWLKQNQLPFLLFQRATLNM